MHIVILNELFIIAVLLVCSGYFSGVETVLLSLPRQRTHHLAKSSGLFGRAFKTWEDHPNRILTAILIGNNAVNITASVIAAYLAIQVAENHGWNRAIAGTVTSATVTVTIILFAEIIPKVTARAHAVLLAPWVILPIFVLEMLLSPFTRFVSMVVRKFVPRVASEPATVSEEDVKFILEMGRKEGAFEEQESKMIHSIFRFSDKRVRDVMVPRTEMAGIEISTHLDLILDQAIQSGYSRLPVYRKSPDNVVGVLYTHDLLSIWRNRDLIVLHDLLRKPVFVPGTMRVDRLLEEFRRGKMHLAIVVDEYGGTAGLVTLEDLVEEIIGDIRDERMYTDEEGPIVRQADGSYLVDPIVSLDELNSVLGLHLEARGEVASLGGYVLDKLGRLPRKGRVLDDTEAAIYIVDADDRSILKIRIVIREKPLGLKSVSERKPRRKREKRAFDPADPPSTTGPTDNNSDSSSP